MAETAIAPGRGFGDPPIDSAHAFRAILEAMARPGRIVPFAPHIDPPDAPLALAGVLLTLADPDTAVWLSPSLDGEALRQWLRFHAGARLTRDPASATFAAGRAHELLAAWDDLPQGEPEYPDRSATLLVTVDSFAAGRAVTLSGPGNLEAVTLRAEGVPDGFWNRLQRNFATFPLGLDCIFCAPDAIAAVPRSNAIQLHEAG
jgi:alpha-D-ribose 1-methylphosphonate 5-triphosphate synthase subunit PhnH